MCIIAKDEGRYSFGMVEGTEDLLLQLLKELLIWKWFK
jgi:hypothetical protein